MVVDERDFIAAIGDMLVGMQVKSGLDLDQAKVERDVFISSLMNEFGGQQVYVPTMRKIRRDKLISGWQDGRTVSQLAIDFDLTERQVYNIVAAL